MPLVFPKLTVAQDILDGTTLPARLPTIRIPETSIADSDILSVFDHSRPLGISPGYAENGRLLSLSIADNDNCRIVEFKPITARGNRKRATADKPSPTADIAGRKLIEERILCRPVGSTFAFDMGPLAMSLYIDLGLHITSAVDIQSAYSAVDRKPLTAITAAVGNDSDSPNKMKIKVENVKRTFFYPVYDSKDTNTIIDLAVRAWVSQFLPIYGNGEQVFEKVPKIDTQKLSMNVSSSGIYMSLVMVMT